MNYALMQSICQFARVLHVRDLCCAYGCIMHALELFLARVKRAGAGFVTLLPCRHEAAQGGSCGGSIPPQVTTIERSLWAKRSDPLNRVRMHATCARIAHAPGHSTYLILTVPIDTTLIINYLQLFLIFSWCQIMLF